MQTPTHPRRLAAAALLAAVAAPALADPTFGVIDGPLNMHANVLWADLSGNTLHSDFSDVPGTIAGPVQRAEILFQDAGMGGNPTRLPPTVTNAFASSLAASDGNGGVGVTAVKFGGGGEQVLSQASWQQTFEDVNGLGSRISLHMAIPSIIVGLYGVPPNRSAVSKLEQALAEIDLVTTIQRANGSIEAGGHYQFGVRAEEFQLPLSTGNFQNFADITFIGAPGAAVAVHFNDDDSSPAWTFDPFTVDVALGTLEPGDSLSYTYQLTARGTTSGTERGFQAFIGDPFGAGVSNGNLQATIAPVPEPPAALLLAAGLLALARRSRR
jgi:hypothetical protein